MTIKKIEKSCGTHDGSFHADEVTACALLLLFHLIEKDKIVRSRNPQVLAACEYVCDVGGIYDADAKYFDHHQADYQGLLSSAGMVLQYLKTKGFLSPQEYLFFNNMLVIGVDAHDNGRDPPPLGHASFSHVISTFNPIQHNASREEQNAAFWHALDFVLGYLKRMRERFAYTESCRESVARSMAEGKDCLLFDENIPWLELFFELNGVDHPALFVIMPSGTQWKLRGIPPSYQQKMQVRLPQPQEWAGLLEEDLKQVSGIPGAVFCHKGRFISVWNTRQDALQALKMILKQTGRLSHDDDFWKNYPRGTTI